MTNTAKGCEGETGGDCHSRWCRGNIQRRARCLCEWQRWDPLSAPPETEPAETRSPTEPFSSDAGTDLRTITREMYGHPHELHPYILYYTLLQFLFDLFSEISIDGRSVQVKASALTMFHSMLHYVTLCLCMWQAMVEEIWTCWICCWFMCTVSIYLSTVWQSIIFCGNYNTF